MSTKNLAFSSYLYVAVLTVLIALPGTESQTPGGKQQYVGFYSQSDCSSSSLVGTVNSTTSLTQLPSYRNASAIIANGLWVVAYNNISTPKVMQPEGVCVQTPYPNNTYSSVTRIGGLYQEDVEFGFYTDKYFRGNSYQVTEKGRTFSTPISSNSWFFTGNHFWTVFSEANYTGTGTCRKPSSDIESRKYGVTYMENTAFTVGSVQYGCNNTATAVNMFNTLTVITTAALVYATL